MSFWLYLRRAYASLPGFEPPLIVLDMDSSGKRSHSYYDSDGVDRKKRAISDDESNDTEYRILCPTKKIGSLIGKGGNIIKSMRQETRAKIKVEDPFHGSDERVIYICSSSGDKPRDRNRMGEKEKMLCAAQEALFKVHERITDTHGDTSDDEDDDEPPKSVTARLLVPKRQVGCLIGKGGQVIEQMRRDIGGQIRVLPKEQRPACALPDDEIVQLSGDPAVVRKALYAISSRLYENPRREQSQRDASYQQPVPSDNPLFSSAGLRGSFLTPSSAGGPPLGLNYSYPIGGLSSMGIGSAWSLGSSLPSLAAVSGQYGHGEGGSAEQFVIRVLCPNDIVGSLIGKGGSAIRKLRDDTGAKIQVNPAPGSEEHIIEITSSEYLDNPISQGINAALHVQSRIAELLADKDTEIKSVTTRLLVPHQQIGSVIGKGGSTISEIRKATRANIRIPPEDERPLAAGENDELVQIVGDIKAAEHALIQVLTQLRNKLFKVQDGGGSMQLPLPGLPLQGNTPMLSGYGGMFSPGTLYPLNGSGLQQNYSGYGSSLDGASILETSSGRSNKDSRRKKKE